MFLIDSAKQYKEVGYVFYKAYMYVHRLVDKF